MGQLTFGVLREANLKRLPRYKNSKGDWAHLKEDGSDWSLSQWYEAASGEMGEYANLHKKFIRGDLSEEEFKKEAAKELADVVTYLDILAYQIGIDLGEATTNKFNEVSDRVNCNIYIKKDGSDWYYGDPSKEVSDEWKRKFDK